MQKGSILEVSTVLCGRCNTFASFSEVNLQFSWQAHHFRGVVLRVFYDAIVRAARSGYKVQIPWQVWDFVHEM